MRSIVHRAIHRDTGEPAIDGKKENTNIFKQANKKSPLYDIMLLTSVCK